MSALLCLVVSVTVASGMRGQRSLVNTFPFNTQEQHQHGDHHAHDHGDHADHATTSVSSFNRNQLPNRGSRQGASELSITFGDVAGARPGNDGKRCIDKVEMIEETEYDDVVQCDHSYDRRCHTTYVTNYESQQE